MYTFKITYIFIIYNLNTLFSYISISVHSTLFNLFCFFLYWCYIASLLCYSYVCLYYHACLHYLNKKWSDKDTDCTCCVYSILKCFTKLKSQESQLSMDIWHVQLYFFLFFFVSDEFTPSPLGVPPAVRWILKVNKGTEYVIMNIIPQMLLIELILTNPKHSFKNPLEMLGCGFINWRRVVGI